MHTPGFNTGALLQNLLTVTQTDGRYEAKTRPYP